ncbi:hypothetical protein CXF65_05975 [Psychrobacter sp. Sarcosine-3u-12]|nr:hypothetical protein CXF65_05975 [Psychrobacter sp. Sarcosine-3u-12]
MMKKAPTFIFIEFILDILVITRLNFESIEHNRLNACIVRDSIIKEYIIGPQFSFTKSKISESIEITASIIYLALIFNYNFP